MLQQQERSGGVPGCEVAGPSSTSFVAFFIAQLNERRASIFRVEGRGSATISEVAFQSKQLTPDEAPGAQDREKTLRRQLEDAERRHGLMVTKQQRLRKQREVLDGFADNMKKVGSDQVNTKGFQDRKSFRQFIPNFAPLAFRKSAVSAVFTPKTAM